MLVNEIDKLVYKKICLFVKEYMDYEYWPRMAPLEVKIITIHEPSIKKMAFSENLAWSRL